MPDLALGDAALGMFGRGRAEGRRPKGGQGRSEAEGSSEGSKGTLLSRNSAALCQVLRSMSWRVQAEGASGPGRLQERGIDPQNSGGAGQNPRKDSRPRNAA